MLEVIITAGPNHMNCCDSYSFMATFTTESLTPMGSAEAYKCVIICLYGIVNYISTQKYF